MRLQMLAIMVLGFWASCASGARASHPQAKAHPLQPVRHPEFAADFLAAHCLDCHDGEMKEGGLDLTALAFDLQAPGTFARWAKIHDKVRDGEMPPKKKNQPASDAKAVFLRDISGELHAADKRRQASQGRGVIRRLNRVEFENALSDLLGIPLNIRELLPPDAKGDGFDTVGAALNVSAVQMESYLQAIDAALDQASWLIPRPERKRRRLSYRETAGMMVEYRRGGPFHIQPDGVAFFAPDFFSHFNSLLDTFVVEHDARYRVKVSAYALRSEEPVTLTVRMGGPGHKESDDVRKKLLGNVSVREGEPQVFEFEEYLERGQMFRIYPSSLRRMRYEGKNWFGRQKDYQGPAVVVQWVEVEGPIFDAWPPASHERLFAGVDVEPLPGAEPNRDYNAHLDSPPNKIAKPRMTELPKSKQNKVSGNRWVYDPKQAAGGEKIYPRTRINEPLRPTLRLASTRPEEDAARLLGEFAPRAFRRPVGEAELKPYVALAHHWLAEGVDFEGSVRAGYKAILTSPVFLYHQGGRPVSEGNTELTEHELAERLAFFLWSSLPDEALSLRASQGRLKAGLADEVERLLDDPRAERFLENFLGQWLDLRLIDFTSPDSDLYPEFDALLQWSMVEETKAFFRELLVHDLSVTNVIDSRFAMLNDRLARHYAIPGVSGVELRQVALPADSPRGGVMTQGSVLKVTANGTTTSPVVRGVWLMERIMGVHPDPPPPGVPAIEPDIRGAVTVREQLEKHRSVKSCAGCHRKIDPPGVALESFDVIGGWREAYRAVDPKRDMTRVKYLPSGPPPLRYVKGLPVDSGDALPDGRSFADIREFKRLMLSDPDGIVRTIAGKLIVYATGASLSFADREEVERVVSAVRRKGGGFRTLIHEVVRSSLFQIR